MIVINNLQMEYYAIQIDVTANCNLSCVFCTHGKKLNKNKTLSLKQIKMILDKAKGIGVKEIIISGGEPTLHPSFYKILQEVKKRGFVLSVTTNGFFSSRKIISIKKYFTKVDLLQFSLDGVTPEEHDKTRQRDGVFLKAVQNIKRAVSLGIRTSFRAAILPKNVGSEEKFIKFACELGVSSVSLNPIIPSSPKDLSLILNKKEMASFFHNLNLLSKKYSKKIRVSTANPLKLLESSWKERKSDLLNPCFISGCTAGTGILYVTAGGELWPCSHVPIKICDISDDWKTSFENSKIMSNLIARKLKGKCGKCNYKRGCGGCRGTAYGLTGDYLSDIPNCFAHNLK